MGKQSNYGRIRRTADTQLNYTKKVRKTTDYLQVVNKMFVFFFKLITAFGLHFNFQTNFYELNVNDRPL